MRITDVANTEQLFHLIQSIPSPKAEPFKLWLAKVAAERLDEMQDPELSIDRALLRGLWLTGHFLKWKKQPRFFLSGCFLKFCGDMGKWNLGWEFRIFISYRQL